MFSDYCSLTTGGDFSPLLFATTLAAAVVAVILILLGLVLLLVITGGLAAGILTSSLLISIYTKSLRSGIKTFVLGSSAVAGSLIGTGIQVLLLWNEGLELVQIFTYGTLAGMAIGFLIGWLGYKLLMLYFWKFLMRFGISGSI